MFGHAESSPAEEVGDTLTIKTFSDPFCRTFTRMTGSLLIKTMLIETLQMLFLES